MCGGGYLNIKYCNPGKQPAIGDSPAASAVLPRQLLWPPLTPHYKSPQDELQRELAPSLTGTKHSNRRSTLHKLQNSVTRERKKKITCLYSIQRINCASASWYEAPMTVQYVVFGHMFIMWYICPDIMANLEEPKQMRGW